MDVTEMTDKEVFAIHADKFNALNTYSKYYNIPI